MPRLLFFLCCFWAIASFAQKKSVALPEKVYINQLAMALAKRQPAQYTALMPPAEVLDDLTPVLPKLLQPLEPDAAEVAEYGYATALSRNAGRWYQQVQDESDTMLLRWPLLQLARYELVRQSRATDATLEKLVPDRYKGYVFFSDPTRRKTFCLLVRGLFVYKGSFYGGALGHVYPAETVVDYEAHYEAAQRAAAKGQKYVAWKPEEKPEEAADAEAPVVEKDKKGSDKGVVGERLYYTGFFDGQIPIRLFVRGYKGDCKEGVCRWNAMMLVGDEDEWVGLSMLKKEGAWIFTELPNKATMELKPDQKMLTGNWNATDENTGYEVKLTEKDPKKLADLEGRMDDLGL